MFLKSDAVLDMEIIPMAFGHAQGFPDTQQNFHPRFSRVLCIVAGPVMIPCNGSYLLFGMLLVEPYTGCLFSGSSLRTIAGKLPDALRVFLLIIVP